MKKSNNKGFSLVELIIVIAIMVVLIGVLAPMFVRYVEKTKQSSDLDALDSCVTVIQAYYADKTQVAVAITAASNHYTTDVSNATAELTAAGCTAYTLKGAWTTTPSATISTDGKVTYGGSSSYFSVGSSGLFEAQ